MHSGSRKDVEIHDNSWAEGDGLDSGIFETGSCSVDWGMDALGGIDTAYVELISGWMQLSRQGGVTVTMEMNWFMKVFFSIVCVGCCFGSIGAKGPPVCEASDPIKVVRGLCVIADFADKKLENYGGVYPSEAVKSEAEIRSILDGMESHWAWMSLNKHHYRWDMVRITLDQEFRPDAFSDWQEFRGAVVEKAKPMVKLSDYDANLDGVVDSVFIIAACDDEQYDWLMGGRSIVNDFDTFCDGQASESIRKRAIGNFSQVLAYGVINGEQSAIFGDFDNIGYLSLMSDSWATPPFGFSSLERFKMGWLKPRVINKTKKGVLLRPAEENMEAVLVYSALPWEYFLIEYRVRPDSGYGSAPGYPDYDGLAIYHVNLYWQIETKRRTPLIRLEKPCISPGYGNSPAATDLWYPGNPYMRKPFEGRPDYNVPQVLFTVDNLRYTKDGIRFDILMDDEGTLPVSRICIFLMVVIIGLLLALRSDLKMKRNRKA